MSRSNIVRIVGWGVMEGDEECAYCGGVAQVYVEDLNDVEMVPSCRECTSGKPDEIGAVFSKVFEPKQ